MRYEPTRRSRNRKILVGLVPPWEPVEPVWELRIGEYRVFYDVDEGESRVIIRHSAQGAAQNNRVNLMKQIGLEKADLKSCLSQAQQERIVIVRKGSPVALMVGVEGMDPEQLELGSSGKFWKLIARRRKQKTISRAKLEKKLIVSK